MRRLQVNDKNDRGSYLDMVRPLKVEMDLSRRCRSGYLALLVDISKKSGFSSMSLIFFLNVVDGIVFHYKVTFASSQKFHSSFPCVQYFATCSFERKCLKFLKICRFILLFVVHTTCYQQLTSLAQFNTLVSILYGVLREGIYLKTGFCNITLTWLGTK